MNIDQDLLRCILRTPGHLPVRVLDGSCRKVAAKDALLLLKSGPYRWSGTPKRVRRIEPLMLPPRWVACYRTTDAAVLPPSIEWIQSRRTGAACA